MERTEVYSRCIPARLLISSGALPIFFHLHFLYLESTGCFFMAPFNFLLILFNNGMPYLHGANSSCSSTPQGRVGCLFCDSEHVSYPSELLRYKVATNSMGARRMLSRNLLHFFIASLFCTSCLTKLCSRECFFTFFLNCFCSRTSYFCFSIVCARRQKGFILKLSLSAELGKLRYGFFYIRIIKK